VRIPSFPHEQRPTIGRRNLLQTAAALALGLGHAAQPAGAATFPTKPVKLVVAYPAGGATDIVARLLVGPLQQIWGQPVVVENITGASGILGAQAVQRAAPDGHTLLITISNTHAVLPHMQALPFDPFKDFTAVTNLVNAQSGVFVRSDVPVKDLPEFFQYARQRGEPLAFGDWGLGSLGHMISASLALDQGFRVNPIHYRGASPVIVAALGGEIAVGSSDVSTTLPHHKAGKLRMLALNGQPPSGSQGCADVQRVRHPGLRQLLVDRHVRAGWHAARAAPGHRAGHAARHARARDAGAADRAGLSARAVEPRAVRGRVAQHLCALRQADPEDRHPRGVALRLPRRLTPAGCPWP